jgi:hypothetical protein
MGKVTNIINEEISAITQDKKKEIFDYHNITESAWRDIVDEAQDFQGISFDFENNDTTGQKKIFYIHKDLRKNQPIKYQINAELFEAGGDWENPVMYFRLQFVRDYGIVHSVDENKDNEPEYVWDIKRKIKNSGLRNCYCIIPPVEAGNKLKEADKSNKKYKWFAYQSSEMTKEEDKLARITPEDKKNCWKWLQELLAKVVDERHKMLD